jgi:RNA polymerase sigma-70 factor (sigma-E family)
MWGRSVTREPDGFGAFVHARRRALLRTAWLLSGDWHLAEDLVQTALVRCYPRWARISADNPDAYVRRVIVSVHASWWRRRWRGETPTATLPDSAGTSDGYAELDQRRLVADALASLPPRQRATVVLRYFEDMTEAQTAAAMGCTVGTVKSQTVKALDRLRASGLFAQDKEISDAGN